MLEKYVYASKIHFNLLLLNQCFKKQIEIFKTNIDMSEKRTMQDVFESLFEPNIRLNFD